MFKIHPFTAPKCLSSSPGSGYGDTCQPKKKRLIGIWAGLKIRGALMAKTLASLPLILPLTND